VLDRRLDVPSVEVMDKKIKIKQKDKYTMLHCLAAFTEFAEWQERNGNIDGSADPAIYVEWSKEMLDKYSEDWDENDQDFALLV